MQFWKLERDSSDNIVLSLDLGPEAKQNLLKARVLEELDEFLANSRPNSLIITSAKPESFCAGADIEEIRGSLNNPVLVKQIREKAVGILLKIRHAPYPVVAAISGTCLGGGLELALACHARIAAKHPRTLFGLPETSIGIIPGFGGTQTLPRVIGLTRALEIIVGQKKLNAETAEKCGLVDTVVEPDRLLATARTFADCLRLGLTERYRTAKKNRIESIPYFGRKLILSGAIKRVLKETKGVYPAPLRAIEAIGASCKNLETGLSVEGKLFAECAASPEARNLMSIFAVRNEARSKNWVNADPQKPPGCLGVVGAGKNGMGMGKGIAYAAISAGIPTLLHDISPDCIHDAVALIESALKAGVAKKRITPAEAAARRALLTVSWGNRYERFRTTDFIVEAITENLEWKRALLSELEKHISPSAIIATNTSSLLPSEVAASLQHKDRFGAMHFFNPAEKMELVEIAGTPDTHPNTLARTLALTKALGKTPVVLDKECAGLVVNRILLRGIAKAFLKMLTVGIDPWKVDDWLERYGMMMGPFKTTDLVGFDTADHVIKSMGRYYPDSYPKLVLDMELMQNKAVLGKKTGKGFYFWDGERVGEPNYRIFQEINFKVRADSRNLKTNDPWFVEAVAQIVLNEMRNEGSWLIAEGVLKSKDMIDLAIILGAGICPNRRGIFGSDFDLART